MTEDCFVGCVALRHKDKRPSLLGGDTVSRSACNTQKMVVTRKTVPSHVLHLQSTVTFDDQDYYDTRRQDVEMFGHSRRSTM